MDSLTRGLHQSHLHTGEFHRRRYKLQYTPSMFCIQTDSSYKPTAVVLAPEAQEV